MENNRLYTLEQARKELKQERIDKVLEPFRYLLMLAISLFELLKQKRYFIYCLLLAIASIVLAKDLTCGIVLAIGAIISY